MPIKLHDYFQLYIKARGLDHVRFGQIVDRQKGGQINLSKLRSILSSLKMPTVTKRDVHLEIIVQIEGKTVQFFFLNQQSFNALTEGDSKSMKLQTICHFICFHLRFSVESSDEVAAHGQSYKFTKSAMAIPVAVFSAYRARHGGQLIHTEHRVEFPSRKYNAEYRGI